MSRIIKYTPLLKIKYSFQNGEYSKPSKIIYIFSAYLTTCILQTTTEPQPHILIESSKKYIQIYFHYTVNFLTVHSIKNSLHYSHFKFHELKGKLLIKRCTIQRRKIWSKVGGNVFQLETNILHNFLEDISGNFATREQQL